MNTLNLTEDLGIKTFRKQSRKTWLREEDEILIRQVELHLSKHGIFINKTDSDVNLADGNSCLAFMSANRINVPLHPQKTKIVGKLIFTSSVNFGKQYIDLIPWEIVCQSLNPKRKARDCKRRWLHSLDPNIRKGKWTEEEDNSLKDAYLKHNNCWLKVAAEIPGRNNDQCAKRYKEILEPKLNEANRLQWTIDDDIQLITLVKRYGTRWKLIGEEMKGRTGLSVRNRWRKLVTAVTKKKASPEVMATFETITNVNGKRTLDMIESPESPSSPISGSLNSHEAYKRFQVGEPHQSKIDQSMPIDCVMKQPENSSAETRINSLSHAQFQAQFISNLHTESPTHAHEEVNSNIYRQFNDIPLQHSQRNTKSRANSPNLLEDPMNIERPLSRSFISDNKHINFSFAEKLFDTSQLRRICKSNSLVGSPSFHDSYLRSSNKQNFEELNNGMYQASSSISDSKNIPSNYRFVFKDRDGNVLPLNKFLLACKSIGIFAEYEFIENESITSPNERPLPSVNKSVYHLEDLEDLEEGFDFYDYIRFLKPQPAYNVQYSREQYNKEQMASADLSQMGPVSMHHPLHYKSNKLDPKNSSSFTSFERHERSDNTSQLIDEDNNSIQGNNNSNIQVQQGSNNITSYSSPGSTNFDKLLLNEFDGDLEDNPFGMFPFNPS